MAHLFIICTLLTLLPGAPAYQPVREYSGLSFFDRWDFYGSWDNLTLGDVWWLDRDAAYNSSLAYINGAGNAVLKVDDTSNVPTGQKRNSVRITTQDTYFVGSLVVIDLVHLPYGCSVWPAFWTLGPTWPDDGEIDVIEAINLMDHNQMALHTTEGCFQTTPTLQTGETTGTDCSVPAGCTVEETRSNSFLDGFAAAGGGVWALQFDVQGIYMWFWSRPDVPPSIASASASSSLSMSDFGAPSASYPAADCDITKFFTPQKLVLDITLCGDWAGLDAFYDQACNTGPTGVCYNDHVVGDGSNYEQAYFEIPYVRTYTTGGVAPTPTNVQNTRKKSEAAPLHMYSPRPSSGAMWGWTSIATLIMVVLGGCLWC